MSVRGGTVSKLLYIQLTERWIMKKMSRCELPVTWRNFIDMFSDRSKTQDHGSLYVDFIQAGIYNCDVTRGIRCLGDKGNDGGQRGVFLMSTPQPHMRVSYTFLVVCFIS